MSEEYSNGYARGYEAGQQSVLKLAEQPAQQEQESWEDLHNALQRIDTAAVGLPTFEVRHEGGLDAVTQNIVDAITALHTQPAQQEPVNEGWKLVPVEPTEDMWKAVNKLDDEMAAGSYDGKGCSIEQAWNCLLDAAPTPPAQRNPLTRKQLADAWIGTAHITHATERQIAYARAIEAAHGIKENT